MKSDHGGNLRALAEASGFSPESILDFSANINPLGLSPRVAQAIRDAISSVAHYPDPEALRLRGALAAHHGLDADQVLSGCGSTELIYLIARALQPKRALILAPAFSEYGAALSSAGAHVEEFVLGEETGFLPDLSSLIPSLPGCDLLVLANPNNPTGSLIGLDALATIVQTCHRHGTMLALDEAFIDFVEESSAKRLLPAFPNLLILRSLTKCFALPGLRVGYLLASPDLLKQLIRFKAPWSVNSLGEAAALAALEDHEYQKQSVTLIRQWRQELADQLRTLPWLKVFSSCANYLMVKLVTQNLDAPTLRAWLLKKGIAIRDCSSFTGLGPAFFRIAVRTPRDNARLLTALKKLFSEPLIADC